MALLCLLMLPAFGVQAQQTTFSEDEVKAAFVLRLATFTSWPSEDQDEGPFLVGVLGDDPVGRTLLELGPQQTVQGRRVEVIPMNGLDRLDDAHVLWVPSAVQRNVSSILDSIRGVPVLTVGDGDEFAYRGGHIRLLRDGTRVRFEVNLEACRESGLTPSSQLLRLGEIIHDSDGG